MRKWELIIAAVVSLLLGVGIILLMNDFSKSTEGKLPELTGIPTVVSTVDAIETLFPELSSKTPESSKENNTVVSPTLGSLKGGDAKLPDSEDLLLLYSSTHSSPFDFNFCQIAEYYGLLCKKIDLDKTEITDQLLQDTLGNYFKLVGIDASNLYQGQDLISKSEIDIIKNSIEIYRSNLLIYNLNEKNTGSNLSKLTDGALLKVTVPQDRHRDWIVSTLNPALTLEFTGQVITSTTYASQIDFALNFDPKATITPIISSRDDSRANYLIFARLFQGLGSIYLSSGSQGWGLETRTFRDIYYSPSHFSEIIPLMLTVRYTLGEETWHNDQNYANLTLVAPYLTEPYRHLRFTSLLQEMETHQFHTSIAFPPVHWEEAELDVTSLFNMNPDKYSLVQYGNNADGYEFYEYAVTPDDPIPARPLADQEWNILEGISRMKMLTESTGIPFDKVMVFPEGISPEQTLVLLKKNNYLASVNEQDIPLASYPSTGWDEKMTPVSLNYGNFPLLTQYAVGVNQPYPPLIQSILFDLFIGKPALMVSRVDENGILASGTNAFNPIADQLNQISGGVRWQNLGDVIKHLHLKKVNDDGSVDVRMYTNDLILTNSSSIEKTYHISKEETLNVPIMSLTVNDQEFPYRLESGFLKMDFVFPAQNSVEIIIHYQDR